MIIPYKEIKLAVVLIVRDVKFTNRIMYIYKASYLSLQRIMITLFAPISNPSLSGYNNEYRRI